MKFHSYWFTHCLYRFLDGKKTSLRGIHRNLKQQKNFNSHDGFFRKSPFCTFSYINPGFGGPWDKLWIFFLIAIFIMLQKNAFGRKKFEFHAWVQKVYKLSKVKFPHFDRTIFRTLLFHLYTVPVWLNCILYPHS